MPIYVMQKWFFLFLILLKNLGQIYKVYVVCYNVEVIQKGEVMKIIETNGITYLEKFDSCTEWYWGTEKL